MGKSKYGNYIIGVDGQYHIIECLTDIGENYKFFAPKRWSFDRFRKEVCKRHVLANEENRGFLLFIDPWTEVTIFSYDSFIKDLGHRIYLRKKWNMDMNKQMVFYHKKGEEYFEII